MKRFWSWLWRKLDTPLDHFDAFQRAGRKINQHSRGEYLDRYSDLDTTATKDAIRELSSKP